MKIQRFLYSLFLVPFLFSCNAGDDNELEVTPGTTSEIDPIIIAASELAKQMDAGKQKELLLFYVDGTSDYTNRVAYMWSKGGEGKQTDAAFSNESYETYTFGCMTLYDGRTLAAGLPKEIEKNFNESEDANIIIKETGTGWNWKTADLVLPVSSGDKHYLIIGNKDSESACDVYSLSEPEKLMPSISSAFMESETEIKVSLTVKFGLEGNASSNQFELKADDGSIIQITDVKNYEYKDDTDRSHNFASSLYIKLTDKVDFSKSYYVSHPKFGPENGRKVLATSAIKKSFTDWVYDKDDLGLTLSDSKAAFKTWAPLARNVELLLFTDSANLKIPADTKRMTPEDAGIWSISNVDVSNYKYYKFRIANPTETNDVCDIYAKAASADSVAAQITDISKEPASMPGGWKTDYYNPFGNTGVETKSYTDAVIYEIHIRDWSRLEVSDSTGKFLDIADGTKVISYIKNLGITHVQLLPSFDYAQTNDDTSYNWGYNPYHYNVPEGRYVKNMKDGTDAVLQFRALIKAFHDAGIAVNMDVVYNHTSGTGTGSLYDMTVPYYYYRLDANGNYSNGSGCGNETDSSAPMFRKYMIDSLKHWMIDYHINGFRFDLMGLHETETMKEIYKALSEIDKNVMVYGEPWTGGSSPVVNGTGKANIDDCADDTYATNGVACFNDVFRNAIKGAEYPSFAKGEVSEPARNTANTVINGLMSKNFNAALGRSINYVECHDNLTLSDKLALVMNGKIAAEDGNWVGTTGSPSKIITDGKQQELKNRDMLAASMMFLAPGTAFINGGQEFMRSKDGDHNSYESSDDINEIKQEYIEEYEDVTKYYKGLISLRTKYAASFSKNASSSAKRVADGLIKYNAGKFVVFFNTNSENISIDVGERVKGKTVSIESGEFKTSDSESTETEVSALSTLIIQTSE